MRPLPNVIQLTHSLDSVASTAFPWKISKSANVFFRFPTTSGWLLPETTLCFRAYRGKSLFSLVNFSPFQRHHYRSFNGTSCTFPCNLHTLPLFSSFCLTFPFRNDRSRAQRISAATLFLIYATAYRNYPPQPTSCNPLDFYVIAHPCLLF